MNRTKMEMEFNNLDDAVVYIEKRIKFLESNLLSGEKYAVAINELWEVKFILKKIKDKE